MEPKRAMLREPADHPRSHRHRWGAITFALLGITGLLILSPLAQAASAGPATIVVKAPYTGATTYTSTSTSSGGCAVGKIVRAPFFDANTGKGGFFLASHASSCAPLYGDSGGASAGLTVYVPIPVYTGHDVIHAQWTIKAAVTARIDRALAAIQPLPSVTSVSPLVTARDGHTALATVQFDAISAKIPAGDITAVIATAQSYAEPGLQVALGGAPISAVASPSPGSSEGIGISAAIVIMLLAFGSVVAMGLPILTALAGVAAGYGVVALISHLLIDPSFSLELMAMIGLGVGIDYALFIVTRYRQGLGEGLAPPDAVVRAMSTAGRAVLFAGTTVLISLLGLFLVGQQYLDGLAVGTILAVMAVMAASLSLLPAMLGFSGRAIDRLHLPGLLQSPHRKMRTGSGGGGAAPSSAVPCCAARPLCSSSPSW